MATHTQRPKANPSLSRRSSNRATEGHIDVSFPKHIESLAAQLTQVLRALGHTRPHVHGEIQVSCFSPQEDGLLDFSHALSQDGERPNCVGQIERWCRVPVAPVEREHFHVTRLGEFQTARILMEVAEMTNRVCQPEIVTLATVQGDRFFVQRSGCIATIEVSLDLTESHERPGQLPRDASVATEVDCLYQISMGIEQAVLTPSAGGLLNEFQGFV
jgi:hypothetical protein